VEVTIPAGDGYPATPGYAVLPAGARRGAVVICEIRGRQPEIDRVVERLASHGYAAVAPDLFRAPSRWACLRHTFLAMRTGEGPAVRQAAGVRRWLCAQTGLDEQQVGLIGFCFGGGFALACGAGFSAISTNYGPIPKSDEVLRRLPPTIGCYGGRDRLFGHLGPVLESRLSAVGVEAETHTFPDVGHSFLTDGDHPVTDRLGMPLLHIRYDAQTAEEGWQRIFAFFDKHL
jgi:carboxymethylenebutenolidase